MALSDTTKVIVLTSCLRSLKNELDKIKDYAVKEDIDWINNYIQYTLWLVDNEEMRIKINDFIWVYFRYMFIISFY